MLSTVSLSSDRSWDGHCHLHCKGWRKWNAGQLKPKKKKKIPICTTGNHLGSNPASSLVLLVKYSSSLNFERVASKVLTRSQGFHLWNTSGHEFCAGCASVKLVPRVRTVRKDVGHHDQDPRSRWSRTFLWHHRSSPESVLLFHNTLPLIEDGPRCCLYYLHQ